MPSSILTPRDDCAVSSFNKCVIKSLLCIMSQGAMVRWKLVMGLHGACVISSGEGTLANCEGFVMRPVASEGMT